jgi:uroporphyrinogen-III synthase
MADLSGKTVLVTRPGERSRGVVARLGALGASVDARPTLAVEDPRDGDAPRRAVEGASRYDWVVLTSRNGVRFFHRLWTGCHGARASLPFSIVSIGPGTADEAVSLGFAVDVIASKPHSEGLAATLESIVIAGQRALVVRPEVASDRAVEALRARGVEVDAVPFYRSVPAPGVAAVAADLARGRYDAVVFTSPSSLRFLVEADPDAVGSALARLRRVAIGPTTAAALARRGWPADSVASTPDDDGITSAVLDVFETGAP